MPRENAGHSDDAAAYFFDKRRNRNNKELPLKAPTFPRARDRCLLEPSMLRSKRRISHLDSSTRIVPLLQESPSTSSSCFCRPFQKRPGRSHRAGRTPDHSYHVPRLNQLISSENKKKPQKLFIIFFMNIIVVKINDFFLSFCLFSLREEY